LTNLLKIVKYSQYTIWRMNDFLLLVFGAGFVTTALQEIRRIHA
jgi:hypothetical protein